ncbi:MAG: hypothetical protein QME94_14865 [Anaerolineae bacterium]|nr:hypothetical protein [Anaerolineae bacterium]
MLRLLHLLAPYVVWLYPIGVLILLVYLRSWFTASRDLRASLFTLEREMAAARMRRAATGVFCVFGVLMGLFFAQFHLARAIDLNMWIRPTPTPELIGTSLWVPTPGPVTATPTGPTPTPTATATRRPTRQPVTPTPSPTNTVEATPTPPPAHCPDENARIVQPGQGAQIRGRIDIRGSANIPGFQFYKIELGLGENPNRWTSISDVHRNPVSDGLLEVWDTSELPAGTYTVRLVVVDASGNYPAPCEVLVYVTH